MSNVQSPPVRLLKRLVNVAFFGKRKFVFWESLGLHATPVNYYQPVPDTRKLAARVWPKATPLVGIDLNEKRQLELLSVFVSRFKQEYTQFPITKTGRPNEYYVGNPNFRSVDGEILYCMIRHFRPRKIIEVGSGFSTCLSAQAVEKNQQEKTGYACELTAIEPFPKEFFKKGFPGLARLITEEVENIPLSEFESLGRNDILFIDSSHVLRTGGDIRYLYLEVLPRLRNGVLVHIHDIFLPEDYPRWWVLKARRFWTEQYVLQAFLIFNERYEVLWASNYMCTKHPKKIARSFPSYEVCPKGAEPQIYANSLWLRRLK